MTSKGAKSFIHDLYVNGKRRRIVLGQPPKMTVESARLFVQKRESDLDDNVDPDLERFDFRKKHAITVREVIDQYFQDRMRLRGKEHRDEFGRLIAPWTRDIPTNKNRGKSRIPITSFGDLYADVSAERITPQHVGKFLHPIENDHRYNGAMRQLKTLFNWAIDMQLVDIRNPVSPFQARKIFKKRRDYTPKQVKVIADYIFNPPQEPYVNLSDMAGNTKKSSALINGRIRTRNLNMQEFSAFMGILFLTMARPNELKQARFEHFNLDELIWHKHNTKGIKLSRAAFEYSYRTVPIHPKVAELINHQKERWPDSKLVFPNHIDITQPRDNFTKSLRNFKALEGVPDHFQLYDVKRMAISLMLMGQGIRREDLSHYVDHKGNLETTMIYDLGFVDPMRPVTDKLGELLGV